MHAKPPRLLPSRQTTTLTPRQAWTIVRDHSHLWTVLDDLPKPTDLKARAVRGGSGPGVTTLLGQGPDGPWPARLSWFVNRGVVRTLHGDRCHDPGTFGPINRAIAHRLGRRSDQDGRQGYCRCHAVWVCLRRTGQRLTATAAANGWHRQHPRHALHI